MSIKITEIAPIKVSGLSSLKVEFEFNPAIVDAIKSLGFAVYHKKLKCWEIPIISLAELVDSLVYLDDIELKMMEDESEDIKLPELTEEEIDGFKVKPYKHQIDGINYMLTSDKRLLLDGCGVGKTNEIIWLAETLHRRNLINHCLVITGIAGLRGNWENEIKKFSRESYCNVGKYITRTGSIRYKSVAERANQLAHTIDEFFILINVESFRDKKILEAIQKSKNIFDMIVFDESHKIGAPSTEQYNNLMKLDAKYVIAATGTLIVNNPISAYPSLRFTKTDTATLTNYKAQYCTFGGFHDSQVIGYKNLGLLREEIDHYSIRRTLTDVKSSIPKLTIDTELLELSDSQQDFYEAIKKGIKEEADKIELNANNLLALTTRLRQATACPSVLTSQFIESVKVRRAFELVEEIIQQNEKVVVFSVFKEPLNQLAQLLQQANYDYTINTGDTSDAQVAVNVAAFQNSSRAQVFLGSFSKMGTGWTLNSAMYMICIDTPYTFSLFEQGYQRIHRISNTRPANIKVLVCQETIDERVQQIIETKKELGNYLVDGIENDAIKGSLSNELYKIIKSL